MFAILQGFVFSGLLSRGFLSVLFGLRTLIVFGERGCIAWWFCILLFVVGLIDLLFGLV